ncbi:MAG: hypothetical protein R3C05_29850 [Pirellulaceae bacterium]
MSNRISVLLCAVALASLGSVASAAEFVAFCLPEWKEMHFDDAGKAQQHLAAVQKLGCEARIDNHDGHTDVVYRSPKWKSLEVADDKLAHQWEGWLKGAGFETLHGHAADHGEHDGAGNEGHDQAAHDHEGHGHGPGEAEEVTYRIVDWKSVHLENQGQVAELKAMLQGLGCELKTTEHAGHTDLNFRCPQWKHIEVGSHDVATVWEKWLQKTGFEVKHMH